MATLSKDPVPGFDSKPGESWGSTRQRHEAAFAALLEKSNALQDGEVVGGVLMLPFADGHACYLVESEKPLRLAHIPYGDAWHADASTIRGLRLQDVESRLAHARRLNKLFAEKRVENEAARKAQAAEEAAKPVPVMKLDLSGPFDARKGERLTVGVMRSDGDMDVLASFINDGSTEIPSDHLERAIQEFIDRIRGFSPDLVVLEREDLVDVVEFEDEEGQHELETIQFLHALKGAAGVEPWRKDDEAAWGLLAMASQHRRYLTKQSAGEGNYDETEARIDALEELIEEQVKAMPGVEGVKFVRDIRGEPVKLMLSGDASNSMTGGWSVPTIEEDRIGHENLVKVMELVESRLKENQATAPRQKG